MRLVYNPNNALSNTQLYSTNNDNQDDSDVPDRLPASYRSDNGTRDSEFDLSPPPSSSLNSTVPSALSTEMSSSSNHYVNIVSSLTPSDLISRFMTTTPPSVQEAVRTTILGLIGSLPKLGWESTTVATGERLAALMFQLQMTGYMFKNAEYRMSLSKSLSSTKSLPSSSSDADSDSGTPKVSGTIKVTVSPGVDIEVSAEAYMSELRSEVTHLKQQLSLTRTSKEASTQKDMLAYIRSLPEGNMKELTGTITADVLEAMKLLVDEVLGGISEDNIGPDTVTEQSGTAMAQLCMWQLVQGYNLRELEVREEMEKKMKGGDA
ncbi:hypothetical protein TrCOL_g5706 [Triparma columacea]|uniref:Uncharacterized protein n=1 Tax=Triparma columacea TaxID=722753 RepID=A0A9W7L8T5_9STRA|nr:hypothetical protein TrCOL_g5706 [Triparma columacea]